MADQGQANISDKLNLSDKKKLAGYLSSYNGRPLRLMEVCGTHTAALYHTGIRQLLSPKIEMLSGPGCPVCVTPTSYIDKLVEYALTPGCKVLSFGDMLRVPGSRMSLAEARAKGAAVGMFYSPEQILTQAAKEPETRFILAAVGFETTAPVWATVVKAIQKQGLTNVKLLTSLKTMPAAMEMLCESGEIDGFLCPGHVAVITGSKYFRHLAHVYHEPMVVGGFTEEQLLLALTQLVHKAERMYAGVWNGYPECVTEEGNKKALALMAEVFEPGTAAWRGLGLVNNSGLYLKDGFASLDAGSQVLTEDKVPAGCSCGQVLTGQIKSSECPLFGKACTPEKPVGACMVSNEGSCRIAYQQEAAMYGSK